jgi:hypothetical protein
MSFNGNSFQASKRSFFSKVREIWSEASQAYKQKGLLHIVSMGHKVALDYFCAWYYATFKKSETFEFQGSNYYYLFPPISSFLPYEFVCSWKNERAVLIPILWESVKKYRQEKKRILEVGNVLSYIFKIEHDVLDKYEIADGVINQDVVDFKPSKKQYDLIVSIFTLQSVGWDETPKEPMKVLRAIENLRSLLAPAGQMIVTFPLGYNPELDNLLRTRMLKFDKQYFIKRTTNNQWIEASFDEVKDTKYDHSTPSATAVLIGIIEKKEKCHS